MIFGPPDSIKYFKYGKAHANSKSRWIIGAYFKYNKISHKIPKCP